MYKKNAKHNIYTKEAQIDNNSRQVLYFSTFKAISLALFGLAIIGLFSATAFSADTEQKKVEDYKFIIADIRSPEEHQAGHFEKSVNVPPEHVEEFFSTLQIPDDTIVLLHCRTGNRSSTALKKIQALGINNVFDVGGLSEMKALYPKISQEKLITIQNELLNSGI